MGSINILIASSLIYVDFGSFGRKINLRQNLNRLPTEQNNSQTAMSSAYLHQRSIQFRPKSRQNGYLVIFRVDEHSSKQFSGEFIPDVLGVEDSWWWHQGRSWTHSKWQECRSQRRKQTWICDLTVSIISYRINLYCVNSIKKYLNQLKLGVSYVVPLELLSIF